jgi:hypothetical protein
MCKKKVPYVILLVPSQVDFKVLPNVNFTILYLVLVGEELIK